MWGDAEYRAVGMAYWGRVANARTMSDLTKEDFARVAQALVEPVIEKINRAWQLDLTIEPVNSFTGDLKSAKFLIKGDAEDVERSRSLFIIVNEVPGRAQVNIWVGGVAGKEKELFELKQFVDLANEMSRWDLQEQIFRGFVEAKFKHQLPLLSAKTPAPAA